jgi:hypothetical protein
MSTATSPSLTPVRLLRADASTRPDFDGSETFVLDHRSVGSAGRRAHGVASIHSLGSVSSRITVELRDLTMEQRAAHVELCMLLRECPPLDGFISPTAEHLNALQPLKRHLSLVLCSFPEGEGAYLTLQSLLNILRNTAAFEGVSDAVVAGAVISLGLHDTTTWHISLTNKLDQWRIKACFWDVHIPAGILRFPNEEFHKALIMSARELDMGPVCLTGHTFLVPIVYQQYLLMKAGGPFVQKQAVDCLASVFMCRSNFDMLCQTFYADSLDGLSIPLPSLPPIQPAARVLAAAKNEYLPLDELLKSDIVKAAAPYAWMFVAGHQLVFPDTTYATAVNWQTAMIHWDSSAGSDEEDDL